MRVTGADARRANVFSALADPTRLAILRELSRGRQVTATGLAGELPVTRQAVAKHLASLDRAGLVRTERAGREVHYALEARPLEEAVAWAAKVGREWESALERLASRAR